MYQPINDRAPIERLTVTLLCAEEYDTCTDMMIRASLHVTVLETDDRANVLPFLGSKYIENSECWLRSEDEEIPNFCLEIDVLSPCKPALTTATYEGLSTRHERRSRALASAITSAYIIVWTTCFLHVCVEFCFRNMYVHFRYGDSS